MPKMIKNGQVLDCPDKKVETWLRAGWEFMKEKSFEKPKDVKIKSFTKKVEKPKVKEVKNAE